MEPVWDGHVFSKAHLRINNLLKQYKDATVLHGERILLYSTSSITLVYPLDLPCISAQGKRVEVAGKVPPPPPLRKVQRRSAVLLSGCALHWYS